MHHKLAKIHIGLRTIKTAAAVIISMIIVDYYGATTSKLIFAMLGAMAAVQPTFKDSIESCLTQIIGVLFGSVVGVFLMVLPISHLAATGIGIILVITFYNVLKIRFSPSLPCFMVVMLCTTPDIQPFAHALGRIWDTAIGLGVGMLINTLVFPYDNSRQIQAAMASLDHDLIVFLEDMFDGDNILPNTTVMSKKLDEIDRQMKVFSRQKLLVRRKRQQKKLETFWAYEGKARQLMTHLEVLSRMDQMGRLNTENRRKLTACGAQIHDQKTLDSVTERDVVTNYHVGQILQLRRELLRVLEE